MNTDFAQNTMKLRRILDAKPNATEAEVRAEYIRQGGLLNKEESFYYPSVATMGIEAVFYKEPKTKKPIKEKVVKAVKKVTKKK